MTQSVTASQQITEEVGSWPGVDAGPGPRGEFGFRVGGRELGHLHGDFAAHFSFPKKLGQRLAEGLRRFAEEVAPEVRGAVARHRAP